MLPSLAQVDDTTTLGELVAQLEQRVRWNQHWVRALHPFEPGDLALLKAVNRGEFVIQGMRNRDLQALLYSTAPTTKQEARRRSAAISRKLACCELTALFRNCPIHIAIRLRPRVDSLSTPFSRPNALPLSSLRLLPHEIFSGRKETQL